MGPPARLKVPWSEAEEYLAREERWAAITEASPIAWEAEYYAATYVFDELIDPDLATVGYGNTAGVATIKDIDGLAGFLDLAVDELRNDPLAFVEDGPWVIPWSITEQIARHAAERGTERVLRHVDKEEVEQRHKMRHGKWYPASRGFRAKAHRTGPLRGLRRGTS